MKGGHSQRRRFSLQALCVVHSPTEEEPLGSNGLHQSVDGSLEEEETTAGRCVTPSNRQSRRRRPLSTEPALSSNSAAAVKSASGRNLAPPAPTTPVKSHYKVVVMGSARAGKTSLVGQFLYAAYSPRYRPTVEDMHTVELDCQGLDLRLDILDTGGSYVFPAMRTLAIKSADGFVLVCALDDPSSLERDENRSRSKKKLGFTLQFTLDGGVHYTTARLLLIPSCRSRKWMDVKETKVLVFHEPSKPIETSGTIDYVSWTCIRLGMMDIKVSSSLYLCPTSYAFLMMLILQFKEIIYEAEHCRSQILEVKGPSCPVVVVLNKTDLIRSDSVSSEIQTDDDKSERATGGGTRSRAASDGDNFLCQEMVESLVTCDWGHGFVPASAKNNINIVQVFQELFVQAKSRIALSPAVRKRRQSLPARTLIPPGTSNPHPQLGHHLSLHGSNAAAAAAAAAATAAAASSPTGASSFAKRNSCTVS